jgi:sterol 3beta-glucosyltransferase
VLVTGWGGLNSIDLPDSVYQIDAVPHDWLFPQMAAVVHHGGAGTTGAGLHAGVPSIITPFSVDQPFWAQRVFDLGVGTKPIPRQRLTAELLADAITLAVNDREMRARAAALGEQIRLEDGVACAVQAIERHIREFRNGH